MQALADRYRLERELGQGGMATVYLAEDLKHHRQVAVKVLKQELAVVLGSERFLKEIEVTANLQHPNILPLYDSGEADSYLYYVMPLMEGSSLQDLLDREKQLGIEQTIEISRSVAAALDYAHRHQVVHRDIKPANVMLHDGQALVADFGIALAVSQAGGERLTETGLSLGTPYYMSPEQATGDRELDARSDVYSLAAMTYEMLTGDPPHTGSTAQAILASLMTEEPRPVSARRPKVPPAVEAAVHKGLSKLPADRFTSAARFAEALGAGGAMATVPSLSESASTRVAAPARNWRLRAATTAAVAFGALALFLALRPATTADPSPVGRFTVPLTVGLPSAFLEQSDFTVSPAGDRIVFAGRHEFSSRLYSRRLGSLDIEPIPDTDGATQPFFSPDGQWIGFVAEQSIIRKVPAEGGPAVDVLRSARTGIRGLHWGDDDRILFGHTGTLYRVASTGGAVDSIGMRGEQLLYWPYTLPGSRRALVTIGQLSRTAQVGLVDLTTGEVTPLTAEGGQAFYSPTGHVLYGHPQSGALFALPFDLASGTARGDPVPVLEDLAVSSGSAAGHTHLALSRGGTLVYLEARAQSGARDRLVLTTLEGAEEVLEVDVQQSPTQARISPLGGRLAFSAGSQLYLYEFDVRATSRLTFEGQNFYPTWSPDGEYITFTSLRTGTQNFDIHRRRADGRGAAEQITDSPYSQGPRVWIDPGRMLGIEVHPEGQYDLHVFDSTGGSVPYLTNPWNESAPAISPDHRWVAYVSDESGRDEVYISAFPDAGGRWQVSENGGTDPFWDEDGTIYYLHESDLYAARVRTTPSVTVLGRSLALAGPFVSGGRSAAVDREPGGGRFVLIRPAATDVDVEFTVVMNWFEELRARLAR